MIFCIKRATGSEGKPCPEAVEVLPPCEDSYDDGIYTIEFKTIADLLEFVKREDRIVIYKNGKYHYNPWTQKYEDALKDLTDALIMIYDTYLE